MNLVAFDTSTEACSVAVQVDGEILSDHRIVQREHATLLLPMLSALLSEFGVAASNIDGVVFGQGPGSFTGLRIAAAAAQGLALAADCGVHGVSTLQAMACGCVRISEAPAHLVFSAIDARMDQIYANTYRFDSSVCALLEERVVNPDEYPWPDEVLQYNEQASAEQASVELVLCGSGATRYEATLLESLEAKHAQLTVRVMADVFPHAMDLLRLTDAENPNIWKPAADAQPVYLRNKVALTEEERKNT